MLKKVMMLVGCLVLSQAAFSGAGGSPFSPDEVPLEKRIEKNRASTFLAEVSFNGMDDIKAVIDSGAVDVSLPSDIASVLERMGYITIDEQLQKRGYIMADGSSAEHDRVMLESIQIGNTIICRVPAAVKESSDPMVLIGQGFLSRLDQWGIDNEEQVLRLGNVMESKCVPGE